MNTNFSESSLLAQPVYLVLAFLALLGLGVGAYYFLESPPPLAPQPTHYVVCVDDSESISSDQVDLWKPAVVQIIEHLASGDTISLIPIHDHTKTARIFVRTLPILPDGAGYSDTTRIRQEWQQIRDDAVNHLEALLRPEARSKSTDILSAFSRVKLVSGKSTVIIFLSDMLHSTAELNLERMLISHPDFSKHVSSAFARSGLQKGMLPGVKVHCLLNAIGINQAQPINDRSSLMNFWEEVCRSLGCELVSFDTNLSDLVATS
jgi:hypothetical protein